jgi:membrane protein
MEDRQGQIPTPGWKDFAWRIYEDFQRDRVMLVAAGVTYYALLATFPATAAIVSLYGVFADPTTINEHLKIFAAVLPGGVLELIRDQTHRIASQGRSTLGFAFVVTLLISLWSANAGTKSLFDALNIIFKEEEKRGFIRLTLQSLTFTIGGIALILGGFAAVVVMPVIVNVFGAGAASAGWLISLIRWPALFVAVLFGLACLYRYAPSRTKPEWRWATWGSVSATGIWLGGSILFSWYVANFGAYNRTYGSLGALIGAMVWMWLSFIVILLGAEIDAEMEHTTAKSSTKGGQRPMPARGARSGTAAH